MINNGKSFITKIEYKQYVQCFIKVLYKVNGLCLGMTSLTVVLKLKCPAHVPTADQSFQFE